MTTTNELTTIASLLARTHGSPPVELRLERRALRGGLESDGVARIAARFHDPAGRRRVFSFVEKRLTGSAAREAAVYEELVSRYADELSPRLLAAERPGEGRAALYLEALRPVNAWPWRDVGAAHAVLRGVARLHATPVAADVLVTLAGWDYEAELREAAAVTLERLEHCRRAGLASLGAGLRWTRRVVRALPAIRRYLLESGPLGCSVIHGDLHPGNAVIRRRRGRHEPVLLDWGRARLGSPLEDVANWLQTLGKWEPEARRRHDTLLVGYLEARGRGRTLDADLRAAYWLAGASNALSGALAHHLSVVLDARAPESSRNVAHYVAREWLRVLRRADACWCARGGA